MKTSVSRATKLLLLSILFPLHLWACKCDPDIDHAAQANIVFVGTCLDISPNAIKGDLNIVFQVDSSWKRAIEHTATVHTPTTNCHYQFQKGQRYLIYANKAHQTLKTTRCQPNRLLHGGPVIVEKSLGKTFLPGRPEFAQRMNIILIGLGLASLVFIGLIVLRKRIFKRPA